MTAVHGHRRADYNELLLAKLRREMRRFFLFLMVCCGQAPGLFAAQPPHGDLPAYVDVTESAGLRFLNVNGPAEEKNYIFEAKGGGLGFFDYDGDGWLDILFVQGSSLELSNADRNPSVAVLYRNQRDGTFVDVTGTSGMATRGWGMGVTFADYDNDTDTDIYLTCLGPNILYRNNGDGTFSDVTESAGVGDSRWSTSSAFGDYDRDGDLDLYVANYLDAGVDKLPPRSEICTYLGQRVLCGPRGLMGVGDSLYRNDGNGTFSEVSSQVGASDQDKYFGLGVVWTDIDNDGDLDILVANDATPNLLFVNNGGSFEEMGFFSGLAVNGEGAMQASMGVDSADFDNDGLLDVYLTHFASDYSTLYRNQGDLSFKDVTAQARVLEPELPLVAWGTRFVDVNLDGWKDIMHANGHVYPFLRQIESRQTYEESATLYLNRKDGTFEDVSQQVGQDFVNGKVGRGVAFGDYDNDGDVDFLLANLNGRPQLLRCDRRDEHGWVMFQLQGSAMPDPLGARVSLKTGSLQQVWEIKRSVGIYSASDPRAHFGVGSAEKIDRLEVRWPDGALQQFQDLFPNRHYFVSQRDGIRIEELPRK